MLQLELPWIDWPNNLINLLQLSQDQSRTTNVKDLHSPCLTCATKGVMSAPTLAIPLNSPKAAPRISVGYTSGVYTYTAMNTPDVNARMRNKKNEMTFLHTSREHRCSKVHAQLTQAQQPRWHTIHTHLNTLFSYREAQIKSSRKLPAAARNSEAIVRFRPRNSMMSTVTSTPVIGSHIISPHVLIKHQECNYTSKFVYRRHIRTW